MYIIAHWNGHGIRVGCMICGEGFDLGEVAYDAVTEDAPHEMIGAVCDACVVLPEAELRQRLRDAAEALRQEAERLDARAEEPIHVPYPQDIRPTRRHIKRMHDTACLGGASVESLADTLRQRVLERQREGN
jgi:hypothetical protein